ncbi:MAG: Rrf2 family transcriptional regulator [Planctomycetota bacterium]
MKHSKSTRYALYAAMDMTMAKEPVTVGEVAEHYDIPPGALAKVFQQLVRAGLARGVRGVGWGYVLVKPPSEVTVLDVISVFEPPRAEETCILEDAGNGACRHLAECRLRRLFDEVSELARCTFASVTLETLVR